MTPAIIPTFGGYISDSVLDNNTYINEVEIFTSLYYYTILNHFGPIIEIKPCHSMASYPRRALNRNLHH